MIAEFRDPSGIASPCSVHAVISGVVGFTPEPIEWPKNSEAASAQVKLPDLAV
jgi:hypothetical protein